MTPEQPDWNMPISLTLTPDAIINSLFTTAEEVHTGWDSCVEASSLVGENTAVDSATGNHCRIAEQEFTFEEQPDLVWHDWCVELRFGELYILAHWRVALNESPAMWAWCSNEAETAFINACVLIGQRVRRGLVIENAGHQPVPPRSQHH